MSQNSRIVSFMKTQGPAGFVADMAMVLPMYIATGSPFESPQRGHKWNRVKLASAEIDRLDEEKMVVGKADPNACPPWRFKVVPMVHLPILGGWRKYVVLQPTAEKYPWHPGWLAAQSAAYSKIPAKTPVRLLCGPSDTQFFGLDSDGYQIPIQVIDEGKIGDRSLNEKYPLR